MSKTKTRAKPLAPDRFQDRRRSLRRRWWVRVGLLAAVLALLVGGAWAVLASSLLASTTVEVVGTHRTSTAEVTQIAAVPLGQPLARLDVGAVEQRVAALSAIASVTVTRSFPHTVRITVVERRPTAFAGTTGSFRLVDATGIELGSSPSAVKGLPRIALDASRVDPATFKAAAEVAASLSPALVARVDYLTASSPDGVTLMLTGGATVRWGGSDRGADKAQVLTALLTHRAKVYDVSAPDSPTTAN